MRTSFKNYGIFLVIAIFVGSVLLSNQAGVNLTHHHKLPQLTQTQKISCTGFFKKTCHVRLTTSIGKPEEYRQVFHLLATAKKGDVINFYMIGNGGQVSTTIQFYNAIKKTKAKTVAIVQGDVYSAHAFISMMMDEIEIGQNVMFLFHHSSAYGQTLKYCNSQQGKTDRGRSAYTKCIDYFNNHLEGFGTLITKLTGKYLTQDELTRTLTGYDVIIPGYILKVRIAKVKAEGK